MPPFLWASNQYDVNNSSTRVSTGFISSLRGNKLPKRHTPSPFLSWKIQGGSYLGWALRIWIQNFESVPRCVLQGTKRWAVGAFVSARSCSSARFGLKRTSIIVGSNKQNRNMTAQLVPDIAHSFLPLTSLVLKRTAETTIENPNVLKMYRFHAWSLDPPGARVLLGSLIWEALLPP